jgi:hypothetical protein
MADLASAAVVPPAAVWDFEVGAEALTEANLNALRQVLERAGVEFISDIGVKLRKGGK